MYYTERNNNNVKVVNKNIPPGRNNWKRERWKNIFDNVRNWMLCVPSILALVCYVNGLHGDFVHDDVFAIRSNADVLGKTSVLQLWTNDFWGKPMSELRSHKSYRPVTVLTFRWNYLTTGADVFYFHAVNVLLHVLVTSLLVLTCRDVFAMSRTCSTITGALFAVHPIHTEAVTGLVGRADVLSAVFFLLSFLAYVKSLDTRSRDCAVVGHDGMFISSLLLAAVGMLCKETGITVLGVSLLYDVGVVCRRGVVRRFQCNKSPQTDLSPLVRRIVSVSATVFVLLSLRVWLMGGTMPVFAYNDNPASFQASRLTRCLSYSFTWAYNCWLLLVPFQLCYDWQNGSIPLVESLADPRNLATLFIMAVFAATIYRIYKNFKASSECSPAPDPVLLGTMFAVIPFFPASNIFFRVGFVLAERILYIPSMGFCIFVAVGACKLMERWPHKRPAFLAILCYLLLMLAGKTWRRNEDWASREALFRSGIKALPHNSKVHYNYANFLKDADRREEAIHHYRETIRFDTRHASAYNNVGTLLDDREEKLWYFHKALEIKPSHVGAHINIGSLYHKTGYNITESLRYLERAVELDPTSADAQLALAWALGESGEPVRAETLMRQALAARPADRQTRIHYGELLKRLGRYEEAVEHYKAAHELDVTESSALVLAAQSLNKLGDTAQAETLLKRAIEIHRDAETLQQLALWYNSWGRHDEYLALSEEASRIADNSSDVMVRQAKMFSNARQPERAEVLLNQVLQRDPGNIDALVTMGTLLCNRKQFSQGRALFSRAISGLETAGSPVPVVALFERGNCRRGEEDLQGALQDFQATLKLSPTHAGAQTNAGTIYHMWDNIERARYHYSEALRIDPSHTIAHENMKKLGRMMGHKSTQGVG